MSSVFYLPYVFFFVNGKVVDATPRTKKEKKKKRLASVYFALVLFLLKPNPHPISFFLHNKIFKMTVTDDYKYLSGTANLMRTFIYLQCEWRNKKNGYFFSMYNII